MNTRELFLLVYSNFASDTGNFKSVVLGIDAFCHDWVYLLILWQICFYLFYAKKLNLAVLIQNKMLIMLYKENAHYMNLFISNIIWTLFPEK